MSRPVSRYLHPLEMPPHPSLEPEVQRAILASWAADHNAVENHPSERRSPELGRAVGIDHISNAKRSLDGNSGTGTLQ